MKLEAIIQKAVAIGQRTGFISFDQLNELCPKDVRPEDIEALFTALNEAGIQVTDDTAAPSSLTCSFCGKAQDDVLQLIASATGFICNECVQLCVKLIANNHPEWLPEHDKFVQRLLETKS